MNSTTLDKETRVRWPLEEATFSQNIPGIATELIGCIGDEKDEPVETEDSDVTSDEGQTPTAQLEEFVDFMDFVEEERSVSSSSDEDELFYPPPCGNPAGRKILGRIWLSLVVLSKKLCWMKKLKTLCGKKR